MHDLWTRFAHCTLQRNKLQAVLQWILFSMTMEFHVTRLAFLATIVIDAESKVLEMSNADRMVAE